MSRTKKSHIQMPKGILSNFSNEYNHLCYYDVAKGHIGTNGTPSSIYTEKGYYSDSVEDFLNENFETPATKLISQLKKVRPENKEVLPFDLKEANEVFIAFFINLLSRDKVTLKVIHDNSCFAQFIDEFVIHDFVALNSKVFLSNDQFSRNHFVTFTWNLTNTPFILPTSGAIGYGYEDIGTISFPITPFILVNIINKAHYDRLVKNGIVTMFQIPNEAIIHKINDSLFKMQVEKGFGFVVSGNLQLLETTVDRYNHKLLDAEGLICEK